MDDLQARFGRLVSIHRKRMKFTQEELAERAGLSVDMISKIEVGSSGARFGTIQKIATALDVDEAELFSAEIATGAIGRSELNALMLKLASLDDTQLQWVADVIDLTFGKKARGSQ